jgi:hypothetical protein
MWFIQVLISWQDHKTSRLTNGKIIHTIFPGADFCFNLYSTQLYKRFSKSATSPQEDQH